MERREFFKVGVNQVAKTAVQVAEDVVAESAKYWIRPPFAIPELEFLLACTRCDDCVESCPHSVVFKLPPSRGAKFVGTPALDLLNKGCYLCEDWPCVQSCEAEALKLPEFDENEMLHAPKLAMASINKDTCLPYNGPECGVCASSCPIPSALIWEREKPQIDIELCVGCGLCREACILEAKAVDIHVLD